jgi:hypothetical protein
MNSRLEIHESYPCSISHDFEEKLAMLARRRRRPAKSANRRCGRIDSALHPHNERIKNVLKLINEINKTSQRPLNDR